MQIFNFEVLQFLLGGAIRWHNGECLVARTLLGDDWPELRLDEKKDT